MNTLPLLTRATEDGVTFVLTPKARVRTPSPRPPGETDLAARMPARAPGPGEQYRFHVDMGTCVGCKCCVVACNEQNGNPAAINWRRVGEIEGGWYPDTQRSYLSMGCNHCVEPTCLSGCPVDAYTKDPATGIVRHSADACIGCQYCTWNCSYGVPQYNPERGVVGKCDMCHGRLALGQAPACVSACPTGAIAIEIVNVAEWRVLYAAAAAAPGVPAGDGSVSTTRITMPARLPPNAKPIDLTHVRPAEPHWPLVVMTVLTQLSVGAFATIWMLQLLGASAHLGIAALSSLMVGGLALAASTLHLGRPVHAYRAVKMWKRSWLSREVLLFSAFSGVAAMYAAALWLVGPAEAGPYVPSLFGPAEAGPYVPSLFGPAEAGPYVPSLLGPGEAGPMRMWGPALAYLRMWGPASAGPVAPYLQMWGPASAGPVAVLGGLTVLLGLAGVTASAYIYRVPSRPAWNTRFTVVQFTLTAGVLGPLFAAAVGAGDRGWLAAAGAGMAGAGIVLLALRFLRLIASERVELRGTARLLSTVLASRLVLRGALLAVGGIVLPLLATGPQIAAGPQVAAGPQDPPYVAFIMIAALLLVVAGELLGRYLFFVSVVPTHMAAPYLALAGEAA